MPRKQLLRPLPAFICQYQRLRLVDRVADHTLLVQPICRCPVETLPSATLVMQRQPRQDGIVDLVLIDIHEPTLPRAETKIPRSTSDAYVSDDGSRKCGARSKRVDRFDQILDIGVAMQRRRGDPQALLFLLHCRTIDRLNVDAEI